MDIISKITDILSSHPIIIIVLAFAALLGAVSCIWNFLKNCTNKVRKWWCKENLTGYFEMTNENENILFVALYIKNKGHSNVELKFTKENTPYTPSTDGSKWMYRPNEARHFL